MNDKLWIFLNSNYDLCKANTNYTKAKIQAKSHIIIQKSNKPSKTIWLKVLISNNSLASESIDYSTKLFKFQI